MAVSEFYSKEGTAIFEESKEGNCTCDDWQKRVCSRICDWRAAKMLTKQNAKLKTIALEAAYWIDSSATISSQGSANVKAAEIRKQVKEL